uniref:ANK_REP_REGION domain-containing protein n=1 Tax=Macrostomum lignano TaxID=282301 RepID=A0A1I8F9H3_9PLAT
ISSAVRPAAKNGYFEFVKFIIETVSEKQVRDKCCLTAVEPAAFNGHTEWQRRQSPHKVGGKTDVFDAMSKEVDDLKDEGLKDLYYSRAAESAARCGKADAMMSSLRKIRDTEQRTECHRQCALAGASFGHENVVVERFDIEPQWLQFPPLLQFFSMMALKNENSILNKNIVNHTAGRKVETSTIDFREHVSLAFAILRQLTRDVLDLPDSKGATALMLAADAGHHELIEKLVGSVHPCKSKTVTDEPLSTELHGAVQLGRIHPTEPSARRDGDCLQRSPFEVVRDDSWLVRDDSWLRRRGSTLRYAEGWANSLVQVNGRTADDSDIDWTVVVALQKFHLQGGLQCSPDRRLLHRLMIRGWAEGHVNIPESCASPDECMPHFFMSDAPLYFKNAGIGGDFACTKTRVRDRLIEPAWTPECFTTSRRLKIGRSPTTWTGCVEEVFCFPWRHSGLAFLFSRVHADSVHCQTVGSLGSHTLYTQLQEDPDLEELLTLAHYSDFREHVDLSLQQMEMIEKERRVAMESQDEEMISWVRQKRWRVSKLQRHATLALTAGREDEESGGLWARAMARGAARRGTTWGALVVMETAVKQRDSWTHAKLSRMRLS